jgi:hypothetical protein
VHARKQVLHLWLLLGPLEVGDLHHAACDVAVAILVSGLAMLLPYPQCLHLPVQGRTLPQLGALLHLRLQLSEVLHALDWSAFAHTINLGLCLAAPVDGFCAPQQWGLCFRANASWCSPEGQLKLFTAW